MQRNAQILLAPTDAVANTIALSQKPAAGGVQALAINGASAAGGVATLDIARRIAIASDGDDHLRTFTITGTRRGNAISEKLAGPNIASVSSLKDYDTVPSITVDANTAGNITAGTNSELSTGWIVIDRYDSNGVGCGVQFVAGTCTWTIESTVDEPFPSGNVNPSTDIYLTPTPHPEAQGKQTADQAAYTTPVNAIRLHLTAFSSGAQILFKLAPGAVGGV